MIWYFDISIIFIFLYFYVSELFYFDTSTTIFHYLFPVALLLRIFTVVFAQNICNFWVISSKHNCWSSKIQLLVRASKVILIFSKQNLFKTNANNARIIWKSNLFSKKWKHLHGILSCFSWLLIKNLCAKCNILLQLPSNRSKLLCH